MYICLHAQKHGILNRIGLRKRRPASWFCGRHTGNRMLWFLDIELFCRKHRNNIDWRVFRERVEKANATLLVGETLAVLRRIDPDSAAKEIPELAALSAPFHKTGAAIATGREGPVRKWFLKRLIEVGTHTAFRPIRLMFLAQLLFPRRTELLGFYRRKHPALLPLLYLVHPVVMVLRLLGVCVKRPQFNAVSPARPGSGD